MGEHGAGHGPAVKKDKCAADCKTGGGVVEVVELGTIDGGVCERHFSLSPEDQRREEN